MLIIYYEERNMGYFMGKESGYLQRIGFIGFIFC